MPKICQTLSQTVLVASLVLAIASAPLSSAHAALPEGISYDKSSGCHFFMPKGWSGKVVEWLGPCVDTLTTGYGVLKLYKHGKLDKAYYGLAENGAMTLGVLDDDGDTTPGSFRSGVMQEQEDRFLTVTAYNNAIRAAKEVSMSLEARGNIATSKYYKDMADKLSKSIE